MNTQQIAISIPVDLVSIIDEISKRKGVSRSKFISMVLHEKIAAEEKQCLKNAYDSVFSDDAICREQLDTAKWFEGAEADEGQEW
ncbi:ribbon-helix-helix domain-containing protein [Desulfococcaceae bacterium HSG9]|nr:ribbon-helix-helix domain-containing protein [Desulfococcaceae bacterium HSG9]